MTLTSHAAFNVILPRSRSCQVTEFMMVRNWLDGITLTTWGFHFSNTPPRSKITALGLEVMAIMICHRTSSKVNTPSWMDTTPIPCGGYEIYMGPKYISSSSHPHIHGQTCLHCDKLQNKHPPQIRALHRKIINTRLLESPPIR